MWELFTTTIPGYIGLSFEFTIFYFLLIGGMAFYAKGFKTGIIFHFLAFGINFMWFYEQALNWVPSLIMFFIFLIIMSFSFYAIAKQGAKPGGAFI